MKAEKTIRVAPWTGASHGKYFQVFVGPASVGLIEKVADGYITRGHRTAVASLEEAAIETVLSLMRRHIKDAEALVKATDQPVNLDAVDGDK